MKYSFLAAAVLMSALFVACNGGTKEEEKVSNETRPRNDGHFLMYYNPVKSIFISEFGKEFAKKDTCMGFASYICSDADGTLYSNADGMKLGVKKSTDGGKTWIAAQNNYKGELENASYVLTAGKSKSVYALSSHGEFFVSNDGGNNWEMRTTPCMKDTAHSSPAFGAEAWLAVSADGKKIIAQAWYFEETVLAVSEDEGRSWTPIVAPTERNSSKGVGFCADRIIYASYDQIFYTDDLGKTWKNATPEKLYAPNCESSYYGYRHFVTDGDQFVVGVEVPSAETSRNEKNKYPGAIFFSKDAGKTFEIFPFPYNVDPTPTVSDEYIYLTFVPKK